jgi:hypothetical protein
LFLQVSGGLVLFFCSDSEIWQLFVCYIFHTCPMFYSRENEKNNINHDMYCRNTWGAFTKRAIYFADVHRLRSVFVSKDCVSLSHGHGMLFLTIKALKKELIFFCSTLVFWRKMIRRKLTFTNLYLDDVYNELNKRFSP